MMKKLLVVFFFSAIILFILYKNIKDNKYYYLAIGDALSKGKDSFNNYSNSYVDYYYEYLTKTRTNVALNKDYQQEDIRIKDLTNLINDTSSNNTLSQAIRKADVITISIGSEELFSKLRSTKDLSNKEIYEYIDNMFKDMKNLIKTIRKLNKNDIFIIGYYNPLKDNNQLNTIFSYINDKFLDLEYTLKIKYVEIYNEFNKQGYKYIPNINNSFPTQDAYYYIYEQIKKES